MRAGALQDWAAERCICTRVGHDARPDRGCVPILIARRGVLHLHGVALGVDAEAFFAAQRQLYRFPAMPGQQRRVMLHGEIFFSAKSSAHKFADYANLFIRHSEHLNDALTIVVYALTGGVDSKLVWLRRNGERT